MLAVEVSYLRATIARAPSVLRMRVLAVVPTCTCTCTYVYTCVRDRVIPTSPCRRVGCVHYCHGKKDRGCRRRFGGGY